MNRRQKPLVARQRASHKSEAKQSKAKTNQAAKPRAAPLLVGGATRGEGVTVALRAKASPRGRASHKSKAKANQAPKPCTAPLSIAGATRGDYQTSEKRNPAKAGFRYRVRPERDRACPQGLNQALIRDLYSPVRVSISIESPISQKAETCSSAPFFRRAVFMTLPEVSPRTDGSV